MIGAAAAFSLAACSTVAPTEEERLRALADKVPDTIGSGPYLALMEVDAELPGYVVYRPADLEPFARGTLGLLVWGNGGCEADGSAQRQQLAEIASHGYLVIAPGKWLSGPNARDRRPRTALPNTSPTDLAYALDWGIAENGRSGSPYLGLVDADAIALGGYDCGALQALRLADDPRVDAMIIQNAGIPATSPTNPTGGEPTMGKDQLAAIHTPVLYLLGGDSDEAQADGADDFARIARAPAMLVTIPTGHAGTFAEPAGGIGAQIVTDWLQWQLREDRAARAAFACPNGRWCADSQVAIQRKNGL